MSVLSGEALWGVGKGDMAWFVLFKSHAYCCGKGRKGERESRKGRPDLEHVQATMKLTWIKYDSVTGKKRG